MLALIAGQGTLPARVASAQDSPPMICALSGFIPDGLTPDRVFRLETLGTLLLELGKAGVTEVCFVGAIRRPEIDPSLIDAETAPLVPIVMQAIAAGDDGALRAIMGIFEKTGFKVRAAHELLPELLPKGGVLTKAQPSEADKVDAARGAEIVSALGAVDVGQACVVANGQAIVIETVSGTDWMLRSLLVPAPDDAEDGSILTAAAELIGLGWPEDRSDLMLRRDPNLPKGGLLFKAPKPDQDRRADLPTIGLETVKLAGETGLRGIVVQEGGVIVLDQAAVVEACDLSGLFFWVQP